MAFEDKDVKSQVHKLYLLENVTQIPDASQFHKRCLLGCGKTTTDVDPRVDEKFETAKHAENSKAKTQGQGSPMYWGKPPGQTQGRSCGLCKKLYTAKFEAQEEKASASILAVSAIKHIKHNNNHYEEEARASALAALLRAETRQDAQDEEGDEDSTDGEMPDLVDFMA